MTPTFAQLLREYRDSAGLSLNRLAALAGCDQTYPGLLERGARVPSRAMVLTLAEALGLDVGRTDRLLFAAGLSTLTDYQELIESRREMPDARWCGRCRAFLDRAAFGRDPSKADGLRGICMTCDAARIRAYRALRRSA